jgi:serine phosphatase RsbU (regulator of sigma subunit)
VVAGTDPLLLDLDPALLATCFYVRFHPRSGVVRMVRAGHCPPLLRLPGGHVAILDVPGGPMLGVGAADYPESELRLVPGSVLALYTDGLVERHGSDIGSGIDRLRDSLAHMDDDSLEHLADGLLRDAWQSSDRADDIALLLTAYAPHPKWATESR